MTIIYRIISKEYITKILSEQKISIDYVDLTSIQSLEDFSLNSNPSIQYKAEDFLFSLSEKNNVQFKKEQWIDLALVIQFGWYYGKIHKAEFQIYNVTNQRKLINLRELNPLIKIDSFDKIRNPFKIIKTTNVLKGAFGLSYSIFKNEYDNFFRKIKVYKDQWIIKRADLDKTDLPIISQLFLFYNAETKGLNKSIYKNDEYKGIRIYGYFLEKSLEYFINNNYSMEDFLLKFIANFNKYPELEIFVKDFKILNERYVKKGLPFETKNPITFATKEFLDLAKTETDKLKNLLQQNELNKTAIFLLGMLNLGDRIDEQFNFDNLIPAIIDLTAQHISNITASNTEIIIYFNELEVEKNRNNKFSYIREYFQELHNLHKLQNNFNKLVDKNKNLKKNCSLIISNEKVSNDNLKLKKEKGNKEKKKEVLIEEVNELEWFINSLLTYKGSISEKESFEKQIKELNFSNSVLNKQKSKLEEKENELSHQIDSFKKEIELLNSQKKQLQKESSKKKKELVQKPKRRKKVVKKVEKVGSDTIDKPKKDEE